MQTALLLGLRLGLVLRKQLAMDWISIRFKGRVGIRNAVSIRVRVGVMLGKQSVRVRFRVWG